MPHAGHPHALSPRASPDDKENNMSTTILTQEEILHLWDTRVGDPTKCMPLVDSDKTAFARAIEQAVLQSAEIQRLKAIETAAGEVLSMPREDGYIVLTVHLDALRAAMEKQS
jgi:hypothetical protein